MSSQDKHSKIAIVGYFEFPFGGAGASRIRNIAKGLTKAGATVTVLAQAPDDGVDSLPLSGVFDGIRYHRTYPGASRKPSPLGRAAAFFSAISTSVTILRDLILRGEVQIVILYTLGFFSALPILFLCKRYKIPALTDVVEWVTPDAFRFGAWDPQYWHKALKRKILDPRFSAAIVISHYLQEQYLKHGYPVLRIPALFDFGGSPYGMGNRETASSNVLQLTFVGGNKPNDGLEDVIEALRSQWFDIPVRLTIIGSLAERSNLVRLKALVDEDNQLRPRIIFCDKLSLNEYYARLENSDVLLMTRRDNLMARASFPTRLPEFLATGRPVIVTSVPDVPEYLSDKEHAFLVPPNSPEQISLALSIIYQNRELANTVGQKGLKQAMQRFDAEFFGPILLDFIRRLG